jgi:hypothetical protein
MGEWMKRLIDKHNHDETHKLNLMLVRDILEESPEDERVERLAMAITSRDRRIRELEKIVADQSWSTNPDRMGGQFTEEERDRSSRGGEGW